VASNVLSPSGEPHMTVSSTAAVILAGGRAERLGGVNKALLEIGGKTMIDRALAVVVGCAPVLLSVGTRRDFVVPSVTPVLDLDANYGGPLAGVAAAVAALRGEDIELLLTVAVDTPFFPADFLERARSALATGPAVIASYDGQDYPTNGLWRLDAIRGLPGDVIAGTAPHSLKRLAAGIGAVQLDYSGLAAEDPFANANTPEDLEALRRRID